MKDDKKDLYEELGLSKDASQEEIRAAFRKRAAETHPDKGGDEDEFKRVSHAMVILGDPEKREKYDRTGTEDTSDPEARITARAMESIARNFDHIFTMAEFHPELHDPLVAIRKLVKGERKDAKKMAAEIELKLGKMAKAVKRLRKKGKEAKATRLENVLTQLQKAAKGMLDKAERTIKVCDRALEILNEHEYEVDKQPELTDEQKAAVDAVVALKQKIATAAKKFTDPAPETEQEAPKQGFRPDSSADPFYRTGT